MHTQSADVIVIGLGAMGGAAFQHLATRGARVIGIDQFPIGHALGSSHGETRIIRKAYFEHPDYVPLLIRAYELWRELELATGQSLYHETGLVIAGPADGEAVPGARLAAGRHGVPIENLSATDVRRRVPWLSLPPELECVFEPQSGFLEVERCVALQVQQGVERGGDAHPEERVVEWSSHGSTVTVVTDKGRYEAAALVVTAGPWASRVLGDVRVPLEVARKPVAWFPNSGSERPDCGFFIEERGRAFYGVPGLDGASTKVAEHTGGDPVCDPSAVDRELRPADLEPLQAFLEQRLPGVGRDPVRSSVCMYTLTPDRHFVIDRHPSLSNVLIACGFSGHGFKFAPVVGEALADLALQGSTRRPIGFLGHRWPNESAGIANFADASP